MTNTFFNYILPLVLLHRIFLGLLLGGVGPFQSSEVLAFQTADESRSALHDLQLKHSISFEGFPTPSPFFIDLGQVESGAKLRIVTTIVNSSLNDVSINKVTVECSCTSVETTANRLKAGESIELTVFFTVPKRGASRNFKSVILKQSELEQIELCFGYHLAGACFFAENSLSVRAPLVTKKVDFRVPIVITPPVDSKKVQLSGTGDLSSVKMTLGQEGSASFVQCELEIPESEVFDMAVRLSLRTH